MMKSSVWVLLCALGGSLIQSSIAFRSVSISRQTSRTILFAVEETQASTAPPPILNGKRVFPYKIMINGLKGHGKKIAAVYAVLGSNYQRGTEGWKEATAVGATHDLQRTLQTLSEQDATELRVAHVRALSFSFPQPNAMQEVARDWKEQARSAGATLEEKWVDDVLNYLYSMDDDDEEDDDEMEIMADAMARAASDDDGIVSPFANGSDEAASDGKEEQLDFTASNVDKVLDEVRPYLIADGGNVSVERVDEGTRMVVLKLQGACGSCSSSTVTMQMGIEKVLKENWHDVVVTQVEDDEDSQPKALTVEAVESELSRLRPALIAMGCTVELQNVDTETGVATIQFSGSEKVRQGLELAILDVEFVKDVLFVL